MPPFPVMKVFQVLMEITWSLHPKKQPKRWPYRSVVVPGGSGHLLETDGFWPEMVPGLWVALFRSRKRWVGIRSLHWDIQTQARLFKQRCFLYIMGGSLSGAGQSSAGRWGCGWIKSAGWFPTKNSPHFGKLSTFWIVLDGLLVYFTMDG